MSELVPEDADFQSAGWCARNFVRGVQIGVMDWQDMSSYDTVYGPPRGFVYFIAIGDPYITHVKIGYTAKDPQRRMTSLQTGCPFKLRMLGFVFGTETRERELHDVLRDYRAEGEWFEYADYVAKIIGTELTEVTEVVVE